jgi:glycosyltransferase involved in cell wall biosynthesis
VATKIGGALETIIDEESGFLIEPFDTDALAKVIDKILEMPKEETDKFGLAGRKNVEDNFSNDLMCQKTIEVYKNLLAS